MEKVDCSFLAELFDALHSAVVLADASGAVFIRNRYAASLLGEIDHLAQLFSRLEFEPAALQGPGEADPAAAVAGQPGLIPTLKAMPCRALCHCPGGATALRVQVLNLSGSGVLAVVADPLEPEPRRRESAEGQVAARAAHEINNPLDGMGRFLNLAGRAAQGGQVDKAVEFIDRAAAGVQRLKGIVRGMLVEPAGEAAAAPHRPEPAADMLNQALDAMAPALGESGVAVVADIALADDVLAPACLFAIACNLLKNARDAMAEGGRLTLEARLKADAVVVAVRDSGPGVPPALREKIFEAFYTSKPAGEGSGLGLAVSRDQARSAGGELSCDDNPRGGGAVFTLTLPRMSAPRREF